MSAANYVPYVCPKCNKKEMQIEGGFVPQVYSAPHCKDCNIEMNTDYLGVVKSIFQWLKNK